jgi:hypothetical protein
MNTPVSFEISKLMKEKGFGMTAGSCYYNEEFFINHNVIPLQYPELKGVGYKERVTDKIIFAPTIAEVVMWLYEKHGIWVFILPQDKSVVDYRVESSEFPSLPLFLLIVKYEKDLTFKEILNSSDPNSKMFLHFDEPIEAYETAIEYCLTNLI